MTNKKIIRYTNAELRCTKCKKKDNDLQGVMVAHDKGHYVHYEDYKLMENLCKKLMKQHSDISCENIRLRNAGDAMASSIQFKEKMEQDYEGPTYVRKCVKDWNAAKEASQA